MNTIVIISCSGKCGGTSLFYMFPNNEKYHYHNITPNKECPGYSHFQRPKLDNQEVQIVDYIEKSLAVGKNIILIDSIRDIIDRKISSYFQNITIHFKQTPQQLYNSYVRDSSGFIRFLLEDFKKIFLSHEEYNTFDNWKIFDYDVLEDNFDFDKKYQLHQKGNLYFLVLRFDDVSNWCNIINSANLPINQIHPTSMNRSEAKWYRPIYQDFRKNFRMTQDEFETILSNHKEKMEHFYSKEEIESFKKKWEKYIV